jgi:hypothetical protein
MTMVFTRLASTLTALWLGVSVALGAAAQPVSGSKEDSSSLTFLYEKPASADLQELFETLRDSRILESWTAHVNRILKPLPHQIAVAFAECGKGTASYDAKRQRITFCYEEADRIFGMLQQVGYESQKQLLTSWIGTLIYELYHELAHTLIDMLWLPVLGREEDSADQFAIIALLGHTEGWTLVLGAADYLHEMIAVETDLGLDPSLRHPFFSQRYYNTLCLIYGSDPVKHDVLVKQGRLPKTRAESCRFEYERALYGWGILLQHFEK